MKMVKLFLLSFGMFMAISHVNGAASSGFVTPHFGTPHVVVASAKQAVSSAASSVEESKSADTQAPDSQVDEKSEVDKKPLVVENVYDRREAFLVLQSLSKADLLKLSPLDIKIPDMRHFIYKNAPQFNVMLCFGSPIHQAAALGAFHAIDILVEQAVKMGINLKSYINLADAEKSTPLHYAVRSARIDRLDRYVTTIKKLLEYGALLNAKNEYKKTPLDFSIDFCSSLGRDETLIKLLVSYEAKTGNELGSQVCIIA